MSAVTILIVDDYQPVRRLVAMALQERADFRIVGEASDGMEAVQLARALQPDVILLDINLPKLNGIEAARQIRTLAPQSKILFLSQESSSSLIRQSLRFGARGYVQKARAQSELIPAIDSVLRGILFVGGGLGNSTYTRDRAGHPYQHHAQFYSNDAILLESFGRHVAAALRAGDTAFVAATKSHRDALAQSLQLEGFDIGSAIQLGTYIEVDAATAISSFMTGDLPDPVLFFERSKGFIELAEASKKKGHRVFACGEPAPLLLAEGKAEAAIRAERLWNEILKTYEVDGMCAYSLKGLQGEENELLFERVCAEHSSFSSR